MRKTLLTAGSLLSFLTISSTTAIADPASGLGHSIASETENKKATGKRTIAMAKEFDVEAEAHLVDQLLKSAAAASEKPGGSIVTQRLIDYTSNRLCALTPEKQLKVLTAIDKQAEKNLLKDGHGNVAGYSYSSVIFVSLKHVKSGEKIPETQGEKLP